MLASLIISPYGVISNTDLMGLQRHTCSHLHALFCLFILSQLAKGSAVVAGASFKNGGHVNLYEIAHVSSVEGDEECEMTCSGNDTRRTELNRNPL